MSIPTLTPAADPAEPFTGPEHVIRIGEPTVESVGKVRDWAREYVLVDRDTLGTVLLVLSELATNAVVYAAGPLEARVVVHPDGIVIAVEDTPRDKAQAAAESIDDTEHGRGLAIIQSPFVSEDYHDETLRVGGRDRHRITVTLPPAPIGGAA